MLWKRNKGAGEATADARRGTSAAVREQAREQARAAPAHGRMRVSLT